MKHIATFTQYLDTPVSLHQRTNDSFAVIYGQQVKSDLTYSQAANELGECILHSLACAGAITMSKG